MGKSLTPAWCDLPKSVNLMEPQFSHLWNGANNRPSRDEMKWETLGLRSLSPDSVCGECEWIYIVHLVHEQACLRSPQG